MNYFAIPGIKRNKSDIAPQTVLEAIEKVTNVNSGEIVSRRRHRYLVEPRHIYCHIMRYRALWDWRRIGDSIERNHATAINSANQAIGLYKFDAEFKRKYDRVMSYIRMFQLSNESQSETVLSKYYKMKNESIYGA